MCPQLIIVFLSLASFFVNVPLLTFFFNLCRFVFVFNRNIKVSGIPVSSIAFFWYTLAYYSVLSALAFLFSAFPHQTMITFSFLQINELVRMMKSLSCDSATNTWAVRPRYLLLVTHPLPPSLSVSSHRTRVVSFSNLVHNASVPMLRSQPLILSSSHPPTFHRIGYCI